MIASHAERPGTSPEGTHVPAEEIARRQGVRPIESVESMFRPDTFESDDELDEFLAHLYASRRAPGDTSGIAFLR
jgi:hypothetical protein